MSSPAAKANALRERQGEGAWGGRLNCKYFCVNGLSLFPEYMEDDLWPLILILLIS